MLLPLFPGLTEGEQDFVVESLLAAGDRSMRQPLKAASSDSLAR
jgi:hypothetical protein